MQHFAIQENGRFCNVLIHFFQEHLRKGGTYVLAVRKDKELLSAPSDAQISLLVEVAQISCAQPAVLEDRRGFLGLSEITGHDLRATHEDLSVAKFDFGSFKGLPAVAWLDCVGLWESNQGRAFRHAIPFAESKSEIREEASCVRIKWRTTTDHVAHVSAETTVHRAEEPA
jgi:hypothetical protein